MSPVLNDATCATGIGRHHWFEPFETGLVKRDLFRKFHTFVAGCVQQKSLQMDTCIYGSFPITVTVTVTSTVMVTVTIKVTVTVMLIFSL